MHKKAAASLKMPGFLVFAFYILFCSHFHIASADSSCPAGTQPATAGDLAAMTAAGISNPVVGMCWNPGSAATGAAAAQAKQYLQSAKCSGSSPDTSNLNPGFALCAQKFVQSARAQDPSFCITSAYRSPAKQLAACMSICGASSCPGLCAEPGTSFHQWGLAIDVNSKLPLSTIWSLAQQQGILNPTSLHSSDPYHIQSPSKTGATCNSGGSGQPVTLPAQISSAIQSIINPQQTVSPSNNAFGYSPQAGQIVSQDTYCIISTNPLITVPVPAGTAYPAGCLNNTQGYQTSSMLQPYCSGNTLLYNNGGSISGQLCPYGCNYGACVQAPQTAAQSSQYTTPASTASTGTSGSTGSTVTAASPATNNVSSGATQASPSSAAAVPTVSTTNIASPVLVPATTNANSTSASSTQVLLQLLASSTQAQQQNPSTGGSYAPQTPFTLGAAANDISQLQAQAPSVTYFSPTAPGIANTSPTTPVQPSAAVSPPAALISYATSGSSSTTGTVTSPAPLAMNSVAPIASGNDTFISPDLGGGANASNQQSGASSTAANPLSILSDLKNKLIAALQFLISFGSPSPQDQPNGD